jgi:uncharacterized protein (TIGR02145 family)
MINKLIAKYKITRLIGEGGMAKVYEAEHEMLGTKVAIKVLNPILSANLQIKERFKNEAKLLASLEHPNIMKVIDFDEQPQQLSIVMEYLNGEDLNQKIKTKGPLSDKEVIDVFSQTLSAFQYAHSKGIVHRDIKPSNIFVRHDGRIKILDFGIAKLYGEGNEMTQTGTQIGTPIYMSPEQVKADKTIDHRSDIYSLGVTMFYAVNGKPPYDSNTTSQFEIFNKIVFEALPELAGSSMLKDLIQIACAKDRNERFESCKEWLTSLNLTKTIATSSSEKTMIEVSENDKTIVETSSVTNDYKTVKIGDQIWMANNLNVDQFANGDFIPEAKSAEEWEIAGEKKQAVWCYYENDQANGEKYGKLYNWHAVNDPRGLAPRGYFIPTINEWTVLSDYLGGKDVAGRKMKSTNGWSNSGNGNNESGFNGLPSGSRNFIGDFSEKNCYCTWWSTSLENDHRFFGGVFYLELMSSNEFANQGHGNEENGFSVRCLKY